MAGDNDPAHETHGVPRAEVKADGTAGGEAELARHTLLVRELVVLQLLGRGYTRAQVAELLGISAAELAGVERSACAWLGAATAEEAVEVARRRGLIL